MVQLTSIIVSHADVVSNHVRHCAGQQMRFVYVDVYTNSNRFWCAYRLWHRHTSFTCSKRFAPTSKQKINTKLEISEKIKIVKTQMVLRKYLLRVFVVNLQINTRKRRNGSYNIIVGVCIFASYPHKQS